LGSVFQAFENVTVQAVAKVPAVKVPDWLFAFARRTPVPAVQDIAVGTVVEEVNGRFEAMVDVDWTAPAKDTPPGPACSAVPPTVAEVKATRG
jgi:hypothetical protein